MQSRRLTAAERHLATSVYGPAIVLDRVRLATAPWRGVAVTLGSHVLYPQEAAAIGDFSEEPLHIRIWFVHELAHVWQWQHRPLWTLASWLATLLRGGYGPRRTGYRLPETLIWHGLNLEQQAEVIAGVYRRAQAGDGVAASRLEACLAQSGLCKPISRT